MGLVAYHCGMEGQIAMPLSATTGTRGRKAAQKGSEPRPSYFSKAVGKALQILDLLQSQSEPVALKDISRRLRLSKTSAFRLLHTLEETGHLVATDAGLYSLAPGMQAAAPTRSLMTLLRVGTPRLRELSRELTETVSLAVLFENRMEVVAVVESPRPLRMSNVVGHILPPHASSLGKVITAYQTPERREKLVRSFGLYRFTSATITDASELLREFDRIRKERFAADREESVADGICFGVPVFGVGDSVVAAISTSIPKTRVRDSDYEKEVLATLWKVADALGEDLKEH
jgi:DNA-binding IclR family transcriptional regulator